MTAGHHYVYLYRDRAGLPLYVGMTMDPARRDREHRNGRFADEIAARELRGPMSRDEAARIEAETLLSLAPPHNRHRMNGHRWTAADDVAPEALAAFGRIAEVAS